MAKMTGELEMLRRDLGETSAALASQKASNKGLQIRVAELLRASTDAEALRASYVQVKQERDALLTSKHQWTTNETCMPILEQSPNSNEVLLRVILLCGIGCSHVQDAHSSSALARVHYSLRHRPGCLGRLKVHLLRDLCNCMQCCPA